MELLRAAGPSVVCQSDTSIFSPVVLSDGLGYATLIVRGRDLAGGPPRFKVQADTSDGLVDCPLELIAGGAGGPLSVFSLVWRAPEDATEFYCSIVELEARD